MNSGSITQNGDEWYFYKSFSYSGSYEIEIEAEDNNEGYRDKITVNVEIED